MNFLSGMFDRLRSKQSIITPLAEEEKIENHFMKGKGAHTSYIQLLQFVLLLLKPYAKNYEAGNQFIKWIHRSVEEGRTLDELMTTVLQCKEADVQHWVREMQAYGGNNIFVLDALQLLQKVKAGDKGLESLVNLFSLMGITQKLIAEAADAVKFITEQDVNGVVGKDWHNLTFDTIKEYFPDNLVEKMQLKKAVSLFIHDRVTDAYPLFMQLAEQENPRAMYFIGEYYRFGWAGVSVNKELGFQYHHKGAEKGEPLCQLQLAYEEGANKEQILQESIPQVLQLAQVGDILAEDELGDAFNGGIPSLANKYGGVVQVDEKAEFWRKKAAEKGYWRAAMLLATAYRDGSRVNRNVEKAITWYEKVYQLHGEHAGEAAYRIGIIYNNIDDSWLHGILGAAFRASLMSYRAMAGYSHGGERKTENQKKAIAWFQKAIACHGDAEKDARECLNRLA